MANRIIDPLTGEIQQVLKSDGPVELETGDDPYIADKFTHKGFEVIIGKIETEAHGNMYQAFAYTGSANLESSLKRTKHEAGQEIMKYIDLIRRVN